eukprot:TRINITY_DN1227_c0_g1_i1.p1 TRINITY_DN1227_c0_g1~~TRINITY_DN1227_c0_g1_i1.p1  ORF type:complete len:379 (+),score=72.10 TRINITY_DN1227_c0_g1_i1:821-1957(+)
MGTETAVVGVRAGVYYFQNQKWDSVDGGLSFVHLYKKEDAGTYRVVGISQSIANKVVINSPLFPQLNYRISTEVFHQWSDNRCAYGLNFASPKEATDFSSAVFAAVDSLKSVAAKPRPPSGGPPAPAGGPPAAQSGATAAGGTQNRGALLGSIQGFNKSGLKASGGASASSSAPSSAARTSGDPLAAAVAARREKMNPQQSPAVPPVGNRPPVKRQPPPVSGGPPNRAQHKERHKSTIPGRSPRGRAQSPRGHKSSSSKSKKIERTRSAKLDRGFVQKKTLDSHKDKEKEKKERERQKEREKLAQRIKDKKKKEKEKQKEKEQGGRISDADIEEFKKEMKRQFRKELNAAKEEIIHTIRKEMAGLTIGMQPVIMGRHM